MTTRQRALVLRPFEPISTGGATRQPARLPRWLALGVVALTLAGCGSRGNAPLVDRSASAPRPTEREARSSSGTRTHTVLRGETLSGIAQRYGLDPHDLAAWNQLTNPDRIEVGQVLRLASPTANRPSTTPDSAATAAAPRTPAQTATPREPTPGDVPRRSESSAADPAAKAAAGDAIAERARRDAVDWGWPTEGRVIASFRELKSGIDIAGKRGQPVLAAGAGRVVYTGTGLRGYGKLVLVKHNATFISAYAHNDKVLVAEGAEVKKGQPIAEMGSTDADQVKLHFQIRRDSKVVDPLGYLPK